MCKVELLHSMLSFSRLAYFLRLFPPLVFSLFVSFAQFLEVQEILRFDSSFCFSFPFEINSTIFNRDFERALPITGGQKCTERENYDTSFMKGRTV